MQEITIRKAAIQDLEIIVNIFSHVVQVMNDNNIPQWDEVYPNREILKEDISKGQLYVGEVEEGGSLEI